MEFHTLLKRFRDPKTPSWSSSFTPECTFSAGTVPQWPKLAHRQRLVSLLLGQNPLVRCVYKLPFYCVLTYFRPQMVFVGPIWARLCPAIRYIKLAVARARQTESRFRGLGSGNFSTFTTKKFQRKIPCGEISDLRGHSSPACGAFHACACLCWLC